MAAAVVSSKYGPENGLNEHDGLEHMSDYCVMGVCLLRGQRTMVKKMK